ncbi:hypothetical protein BHE74_00047383, partial [Ensete ventricosum]
IRIVLLKLVIGRGISDVKRCRWNAGLAEETNKLLRMADATIRGEVGGKEEVLL